MRIPRVTSLRIMAFTAVYLALTWAAVFLVDGRNAFGLRDRLERGPLEEPLLWFHLFRERGPTELLQWLMLAIAALLAARLGGRLAADGLRKPGAFWTLFAVALFLMLIEDAGNVRHHLWIYARHVIEDRRTIFELVYFAGIASVLVYAVARYWRYVFASRPAVMYLAIAFAFYAGATTASATHLEGFWYERAGIFIHDLLADGEMPRPPGWSEYVFHFWLMDFLVEESLELVGAASLLAAVVAYAHHLERDPRIAEGTKRPFPFIRRRAPQDAAPPSP